MIRLLSASYVTLPYNGSYKPMLEELRGIFEKYNNNGIVSFVYETVLYCGDI